MGKYESGLAAHSFRDISLPNYESGGWEAVESVSVKPEGVPTMPWSAIPLDTVQLHTYIDCMARPSAPHRCYALAFLKSTRHPRSLSHSPYAPPGPSVWYFSVLRPAAAPPPPTSTQS